MPPPDAGGDVNLEAGDVVKIAKILAQRLKERALRPAKDGGIKRETVRSKLETDLDVPLNWVEAQAYERPVPARTLEEYEALKKLLAPLTMPVYLLVGNHDERQALREVFADHAYLHTGGEFVHYAVDVGPLRLIALDSQMPRQGGGHRDDPRDGSPRGECAADHSSITQKQQSKRLLIESRWVSKSLAFAAERRLNN